MTLPYPAFRLKKERELAVRGFCGVSPNTPQFSVESFSESKSCRVQLLRELGVSGVEIHQHRECRNRFG